MLVPPKSKYGYDLIAETGQLRFLEHKQIQEIGEELSRRGIDVPERTIQWLCDRFLLYTIAVHWESLPRLSQLFKTQGGYVLHIDGSGKSGPILAMIDTFKVKGGRDHHGRALRRALGKVAKMITERRGNLFAPNVLLNVNGKETVRKLPRTNTPEESGFRKVRRHSRRIRENSDIERQFQRDGPGKLMVQNLTDREYVRLVYGSMGQMAIRFSKVSQESLERAKSYMGVPLELSTVGNH